MCGNCWGQLSGALGALDWLVLELDVTLSRQVRYGSGSIGVVIHATEQPLPLNLATSDTIHQLRNTLTTWVRLLHYEHAVRWQVCDTCQSQWHVGAMRHDVRPPLLCPGTWVEFVDPLTLSNTLPELARWLLRHPTWIRSHSAAGELHRDVMRDIGRAERAIDRPEDRVYLGTCSAPVVIDEMEIDCPQDLYAIKGADYYTCFACGMRHDVQRRREVLLAAVEDQVAHAGALASTLTALGVPMADSTIRAYASKGRITHVSKDSQGRPQYRVGTVLDVFLKRKVAS
jgi:hypothetical protein